MNVTLLWRADLESVDSNESRGGAVLQKLRTRLRSDFKSVKARFTKFKPLRALAHHFRTNTTLLRSRSIQPPYRNSKVLLQHSNFSERPPHRNISEQLTLPVDLPIVQAPPTPVQGGQRQSRPADSPWFTLGGHEVAHVVTTRFCLGQGSLEALVAARCDQLWPVALGSRLSVLEQGSLARPLWLPSTSRLIALHVH